MDLSLCSFKIQMEDCRLAALSLPSPPSLCLSPSPLSLNHQPHEFLQVKRSDGGYIDVPYMSDAILVNLGALMQQWTSDKYLATVSLSVSNVCTVNRLNISPFPPCSLTECCFLMMRFSGEQFVSRWPSLSILIMRSWWSVLMVLISTHQSQPGRTLIEDWQ